MQSEKQYIELYRQFEKVICQHSPVPMNTPRAQAYAAFCRQGLPTRKQERYKYTDLQQLFAPDFGLNLNRLEIPFNPADIFHCEVPNLSTLLFYVLNDSPYIQSPGKERLPEGVSVGTMAEMCEKNPHFIDKYYAKLASSENDPVTALNTMMTQDALVVHIERNIRLSQTIQVVNLLRGNVPMMNNRRVLIVVEEGAEARLLFCDHTLDDQPFLTTEVVEAFVGTNASLEIYNLEETHSKNIRVSNTFVRQGADSRLHHHNLTLHNGTTRNTLEVYLAEPGAECQCNGAVIADKQQKVDNNTLIVHQTHHCQSTELYKYVLNQQSTGAFAGRVLVEKDAQQTVSQETNQNLCLTDETRMYSQPMLEIYADDVKCSHGSTVGQLNEAAVFYMQQRGISQDEAKLLLQTAFINEVIDKIQVIPLRDRLHHLVNQRFRGKLNQCEGCKLCK